ncbi:putative holliday junction resolvase [Escherichia coli]|uniref:Putative holliday junction resolvase n=1 Tax=Escherichia coli TaxID=562 RepID=A0A376VDA0_ECOLX|nr:putative holliday junction resolvase [Escherichia coli]
MSGTLLAFDFGTKSIGVAVGQRITGTARPLPAIKAQDGTPDWNIIERFTERVAAGRNHRRFAAEYGRHRTAVNRQSA